MDHYAGPARRARDACVERAHGALDRPRISPPCGFGRPQASTHCRKPIACLCSPFGHRLRNACKVSRELEHGGSRENRGVSAQRGPPAQRSERLGETPKLCGARVAASARGQYPGLCSDDV